MRKWEPVQRGYCWPDQSHHQSNCSVIFVCFVLFLQGFCWRKRFCWRVKALGHSILVTKAKGTFVQVWARNVLQPSKLKFLLGRHLVTNSFGLGRLFYKASRQLQNFSRDGKLGRLSYVTSKGDAVVRALASHQCGPGSNPGVDAICGLSLLLVLSLAPRGFSLDTPVFPFSQKPTLPNSNSIWSARTRLNEFIWTPKCFVGKKVIYNFI